MSELDVTIPPKVDEVIRRFGRNVVWQKRTKVYNHETDQTTISSPANTTVRATPPASCVVDYVSTVAGAMAQQVGLRFITTPTFLGSIVPNIHEDTVLINGVPLLVVRVDSIYTGDKIAAYKVYLVGTNGIPTE